MGKKGRPSKHVLTYAQEVWDNYNQYVPVKEASEEEFQNHKDKIKLEKMQKALTDLSKKAGFELTKAEITITAKRILHKI